LKKRLGQLAALLGLLAAGWLIAHDNPRALLALMRMAAAGFVLAALVHLLPMLANARAWQTLIRRRERPTLLAMLHLVWLRESVNGLLPVARLGGELVSFRLLRRLGLRAAGAAGCIVVDVQLFVVGQLIFTLLGVGYLATRTSSASLRLAGELAWGLAALAPLLLTFALLHHARPFERVAALLNRASGGKWADLVGRSIDLDRQIKGIWRRKGTILRFLFVWYPVQCVATALELWVALQFLHAPLSWIEVVVLESLIQAANSAAFFVPGALGIQEGAFVALGGVFGLDAPTSLALSGARRIRDLVIYAPGLIAWQVTEAAASPALRAA
jgi:putative membrane protein